ncbi:MAG: hypothetical protein ABIH23_30260 [bacterium]
MERIVRSAVVLSLLALVPMLAIAQSADSPESAGITPVTGDLTPWRPYGVDAANYENVWVVALNDGTIVAFKLAMDMQGPGVIGGSEFLMFGPDGTQLTPMPVMGTWEADGNPTPLVDYAGTGAGWGAFTMGARPDRANGTGFVVHNQMEAAAFHGLPLGDVLGDEAGTVVQLFDNSGSHVGSNINAFGTLTAEEGSYRDIGADILSNGDIVAVGEDRQSSDDAKDAAGLVGGEAVVAVILGPDGSTKKAPFLVHTDANGQYIGTDNSSVVYQNVVAFGGGFVIDHGAGIRWYNNDGTPRTPSQADHAELDGIEVDPVYGFLIGANTGGRGDGMAMASNGKNLVVKSVNIGEGTDSIGILIYYNTDGTVRNWVRFDDTNLDEEIGGVDRTFCDMDENGNVFVVWLDERVGSADGELQIYGRFFNSEGEPYGPSFPVYANTRTEVEMLDYGYREFGAGAFSQPRCAINSQVAAVIDASTIVPDIPDIIKQLAQAFDGVAMISDAVVRIFENPYAPVGVQDWSLY